MVLKNISSFLIIFFSLLYSSYSHAKDLYDVVPVAGFGLDNQGHDLKHFAEVRRLDQPGCQDPSGFPGGHLYRGGEPAFMNLHGHGEDSLPLKMLKEKNIGLVIDLRHPDPHHQGESKFTENEESVLIANQIDYINFPPPDDDQPLTSVAVRRGYLAYHHAAHENQKESQGTISGYNVFDLTRAVVEKLRLALKSGVNVYVHCVRGEDRTGLLVALFRDCAGAEVEFGPKNFAGQLIRPPHDNYGGSPFRALADIYHELQSHPENSAAGPDYLKALQILAPLR